MKKKRNPNKDVLTVLRRALGKIERGWTKGSFVEFEAHGQRSYCAIGAIDASTRSEVTRDAAEVALTRSVFSSTAGNVIVWNDHHARRKRDVVNAFKKAIKHVEKSIDE